MANDLLRGRQTVAPLTNKSGGGVVAGDVVVLDSANASSFTTTTTSGLATRFVGVALETIASNASGRVLLFGYAPIVNLNTSAALGDLLKIHTVAKQATPVGSSAAGVFGQVLETGTTPKALIWGRPDQGGGGGGGGAPTTATYVTEDADATLSAEVLTTTLLATGAHGSRPAPAKAGRFYWPTDGLSVGRDNGSSYDPFGPVNALTKPPTVASGTALNAGSSVISEEKDLLHLFVPKESALNIRGMHWAAPATPYTITARVSFNPIVVSQMMFGVMWRQSSDGKLVTAHLETAVSSLLLNVYKWSGPTAVSAVYVSLNWWQHGVWFKLEDDGSNRKVHISTDGLYFTQIHTVGRTDFLTADQVGFFGIANTASAWDMHGTLASWKQA
jgi:hypothetical protein